MKLYQQFLLVLFSISLFVIFAHAQSTPISSSFPIKLVCTYRLSFIPDSTNRVAQTEIMDLFITDSLSSFRSRNRFKRDSIIANNSGAITSTEASQLISKALQSPSPKFTYIIFKKIKNNTCVVYDNIFRDNFLYKEENYPINWQIQRETEVINGYNCQKAITTFAGRNYTAWFTRAIPVSEGPYKFSNLPGLIIKVSDFRNNYTFELIQITKPKIKAYLSLPNQKVTYTTKKDFFLATKAAQKDAINRLSQMGFGINNQQQVNAEYQNKLKHKNNPLELVY